MLGQDFILNGSTILTHGFSRVVLNLLKMAAANGKHFNVICTGAAKLRLYVGAICRTVSEVEVFLLKKYTVHNRFMMHLSTKSGH